MKAGSRQSTWTTAEPQGVTFVELFFDLVFVYAVTQITALLRANLDLGGVGRSLLVLWLVWWAWTQFTWTLNPADTTQGAVRVITLAATGAAFFMAQAVPDAFESAGAWFAVGYVVVRVLGMSLQVEATLGTEYMTGTRIWVGFSAVGLVAVLLGSFVDSPGREVVWTVAFLVDIVSAAIAGRGTWSLNADHFAERHGLIIIIALGESLIAAGVAVADATRNLTFAVGALAAVTLVSAAWWIYFGSTMSLIRQKLEATPPERRGAVARDLYSFGHLPIVAGIIAVAVPIEEVLAHPEDPLQAAALVALGIGALLYVGAVTWLRYHAAGHWPGRSAIVVLVIFGWLLIASEAPGLLTLAAVAVALVVEAVVASLGEKRSAT